MCSSLKNYAVNEECKNNCKNCCYGEYKFCTRLPDASYAVQPSALTENHEEIINFLDNKLSNSTFLGIRIGNKPIVDISNIKGIYYLAIKDRSGAIIRRKLLLRYVCAKISFQCRLKCLS